MKEKKRIKNIILNILILILIAFIIYQVIRIFAAYKTKQDLVVNADVSPWYILVNDSNIVETESFDLTDIKTKGDKNTADGKIAPGTEVEIPIVIDGRALKNMGIKYQIKVEEIEEEKGSFSVTKIYIENEGKSLTYDSKTDTYEGIMKKEEIEAGNVHNIKVDMKWENDESNNENDTELSQKTEKAKIKIKVTTSQYMEEENTTT